MSHAQTWVKVNAPVDRGIAPVIHALSGFPELQTIESCQGDSVKAAWVCFRLGDSDSWKELARFVLAEFGPALARRIGDRARVTLHVTEAGRVIAELSVRPGAVTITAQAIERVRKGGR